MLEPEPLIIIKWSGPALSGWRVLPELVWAGASRGLGTGRGSEATSGHCWDPLYTRVDRDGRGTHPGSPRPLVPLSCPAIHPPCPLTTGRLLDPTWMPLPRRLALASLVEPM